MVQLTSIALIEWVRRSAHTLLTRDRLLASGLVVFGLVDSLVGLGLVAVDELRGCRGRIAREVGDCLHVCSGDLLVNRSCQRI